MNRVSTRQRLHRNAIQHLLLTAGILAASCPMAWAGTPVMPASGPISAKAVSIPASTTAPPLHSQAALDAWLQATTGTPTPLDALSAGGKRRFLGSLVFGEHGLASFGTDDLGYELTREQIHAVLALFDATGYENGVPNARPLNGWPQDPPGDDHFGPRYDRLAAIKYPAGGEDEKEHALRIDQTYLTAFPLVEVSSPQELSDADLLWFLRASMQTSPAIATNRQRLDTVLKALQQAQQRHLDSPGLFMLVQTWLLAGGQLERASQLADRFPTLGLVQVPYPVRAAQAAPGMPTWWLLDTDGQHMIEQVADLRLTRVLILAGCHFSAEAARDIAQDPQLGPVFARHAQWLGLSGDLSAWADWNRRFPTAPMALIVDRATWTVLPDWNMPTFAVIQHGHVVETMSGWRSGDMAQRARLLSLLQRHGLAPP